MSRCQHQAADASPDCTDPAVLCEHHGGHDGCAVYGEGRYQQGLTDARYVEREEIARALEAQAAILPNYPESTVIQRAQLEGLALKIRDGSIREWLLKARR